MKLNDIATELSADVLSGTEEQLAEDVSNAAASDLMSDILARLGTPDLMLTGLVTAQAIRTSAVAEIKAVVIVRGKNVDEKLVTMAREEGIVLMRTAMSLFDASGMLHAKGLRGSSEMR